MRKELVTCRLSLIIGFLLLASVSFNASSGIVEDDGKALRFIHDEQLSKEARGILTKNFLARFDIWFKASLVFFIKYHKPKDLVPSDNFKSKYDLKKRSILNNDEMLTVTKKQRSNNRHIIFLHGGAYVFAKRGLKVHEKEIDLIARYLGDRVTFIDYTGTQKSNYKKLVSTSRDAYLKLLAAYPNDEFIIFGNSAGSNLALLLSQTLKKEGVSPRPMKHILLSAWADISIDNPEMPRYEFYDVILSMPGIKYAADLFRAGVPYNDSRVSPLYGDFENLGEIAIFSGTYDLVYPDSLRLYEKAKSSGLRVHHYQYNKMWHDWMVLGKVPPEGYLAWEQAAEFVK